MSKSHIRAVCLVGAFVLIGMRVILAQAIAAPASVAFSELAYQQKQVFTDVIETFQDTTSNFLNNALMANVQSALYGPLTVTGSIFDITERSALLGSSAQALALAPVDTLSSFFYCKFTSWFGDDICNPVVTGKDMHVVGTSTTKTLAGAKNIAVHRPVVSTGSSAVTPISETVLTIPAVVHVAPAKNTKLLSTTSIYPSGMTADDVQKIIDARLNGFWSKQNTQTAPVEKVVTVYSSIPSVGYIEGSSREISAINDRVSALESGAGNDSSALNITDTATSSVAGALLLGRGAIIGSYTPTNTLNSLYNIGGVLYWNGSPLGGSGSTSTIFTDGLTLTNTDLVSDPDDYGLSITLAGAGTAARGIVLDAPDGTTGNLLTLQNTGSDRLILTQAGNMRVSGTARFGGGSNAPQLTVRGVGGQTNANPLLVLEASNGNDLLWLNSDHETNTFIGREAGLDNDGNGSAIDNIFIGYQAGYQNIGGYENIAIGTPALESNLYGSQNIAIGLWALTQATSTSQSVAIGINALGQNKTGDNNTALGFNAGYDALGNNNVFIGSYSGYGETGSNKLYIHASGSTPTTPLVYGDFAQLKFGIATTTLAQTLNVGGGAYISGNVGIGTTTPSRKLGVFGDAQFGTTVNNAISITNTDSAYGAWLRNDGTATVLSTNAGSLYLGYAGNSTKTIHIGNNNPGVVQIAGNANTGTLVVSSGSNVGIGTTSPLAKLAIVGSAGINPLTVSSSTGASLFTISQTGTVGINDSTPLSTLKLDVNGRIGNSTNRSGSYLDFSSSGYLTFSSDATDANIGVQYTGGTGEYALLGVRSGSGAFLQHNSNTLRMEAYGGVLGSVNADRFGVGEYGSETAILDGNTGGVVAGNLFCMSDFLSGIPCSMYVGDNTSLYQINWYINNDGQAYFNNDVSVNGTLSIGDGGNLLTGFMGQDLKINASAGVDFRGSAGYANFGTSIPIVMNSGPIYMGNQAGSLGGTIDMEKGPIIHAKAMTFGPTSTVYALLTIQASTTYSNTSSDLVEVATSTGPSYFRIKQDGKIGVGTASPQQNLHVYRNSDGAPVRFEDTNGYCEINPTSTTWTCTSDLRLKKDIATISPEDALTKIKGLRPVTFRWKNQTADDTRFGLIAQEVEQVLPEFVQTDERGYKSVSYGSFTPIILSALQKIDARVTALEETVAAAHIQNDENTIGGQLQQIIRASIGVFTRVETESIKTAGIEMTDTATGQKYCIRITSGEWNKIPGECANANSGADNTGSVGNTGLGTHGGVDGTTGGGTATSTASSTLPIDIATSTTQVASSTNTQETTTSLSTTTTNQSGN